MKKVIIIALLCMNAYQGYAQLKKVAFKTIGTVPVYDVPEANVLICKSGMRIDADGAPTAYHQDSKLGLDRLENAGKPGNWYGILTNNKGIPYVQQSTDPAPGYYISTTSLYDRTKKVTDPYRYVDATKVPYFVIPGKFGAEGFGIGDIVLVVNTNNNKRCFAIVGDQGNKNEIGECSVYLAKQLGVAGNARAGGATQGIVYMLIKRSGVGNGRIYTAEEIQRIGKEKLGDDMVNKLLAIEL